MKFLKQIKHLGRESFEALNDGAITLRQIIHARKQVLADENRMVHLLLMHRDEYVKPTIKCVNSIWLHSPESSIVIWTDPIRRSLIEGLIHKFHRKDRVSFKDIPLPEREWQRNKLDILVRQMAPRDVFTDADMIWNSRPPTEEMPLFFLDEYELSRRTLTRWLLGKLELDQDPKYRMLNVSCVIMDGKSKDDDFAKRCEELYEKIRFIEADSNLGVDDIPTIHRMSEQLAISIAICEISGYKVLKQTDSYMDGGVAESYYLGAINGYD